MTSADHIAEDHEGPDSLRSSDIPLWMFPLMLLQYLCRIFTNDLKCLSKARKQKRLPTNWQSHYANLRNAEWCNEQILREGVKRLLANQQLNLETITCTLEPPNDFQPPMPTTAHAMHQRMEALARFHADPETFIRRIAARIQRELNENPLRLATSSRSTSPACAVEEDHRRRFSSLSPQDWGRWQPRVCAADGGGLPIRAPPLLTKQSATTRPAGPVSEVAPTCAVSYRAAPMRRPSRNLAALSAPPFFTAALPLRSPPMRMVVVVVVVVAVRRIRFFFRTPDPQHPVLPQA